MAVILVIITIALLLLVYITNKKVESEFVNFWAIKTEYERSGCTNTVLYKPWR